MTKDDLVYCECARGHVPRNECGRCETLEDVRRFAKERADRADGERVPKED